MAVEGDHYEFRGPASGIFGRQQNVGGNNFIQNVHDREKLIADLSLELENLLPRVSAEDAKEVRDARLELISAGDDRGKLKAAIQRAAGVAVFVGEIGAPAIEAVRKLVTALGLS